MPFLSYMKLKQLPQDFKVEELSSVDISQENKGYKVYSLEKKGMETFSLLAYLSKKNNIPVRDFRIAGLKDRHAITNQKFTIPSKYGINTLIEPNFKITFLGYSDEPMKLGNLKANRFEIVVRAIKKDSLDGIKKKAAALKDFGVPNYFDSQRFGSVINNKFILKYILKKDYEGALKIYLTEFSKYESRKFKDEKRLIAENWPNLSKFNAKNGSIRKIVWTYNKTGSWLEAYKQIPANVREIMVSAYQSYLWNECVKEVLKRAVGIKELYSIKYNIGSLLFYKTLNEDQAKLIPAAFKTISDEITPSEFESRIIHKILDKEHLKIGDFAIKQETGNFFKTHERDVILRPMNLYISDPQADEINDKGSKSMFKVKLSFELPKGSYATMITKRIFNH